MKTSNSSYWKSRTFRLMVLGLGVGAAVPMLLSTANAARPCCQAPCDCAQGGVRPATPGTVSPDGMTSPDGMDVPPEAADGLDDMVEPYSDYDTVASSPLSLSPNMIGDFFGGGYSFGTSGSSGFSLPIAAGDRRFKVSENLSPLPRDRVYFSYNHFHNAIVGVESDSETDLHRYTGGFEKTFWDGLGSVELRLPFASGLSSVQTVDGNQFNDGGTEFGNISIIPKFILRETDRTVLSAGLGINLPTAEDAQLVGPVITDVLENDSVHLMPFLGLLVTPNENTYLIGYVQADFDANGNTYYRELNGLTFDHQRLHDPNLLHLDLAVGRWIYRNDYSRLSGIAPQVELHYSTTMQDFDEVTGPVNAVTDRMDTLTLTGGVNFQFFNASALTVGCAVPLRGHEDDRREEKQFDAEVQILFNRWF